MEFQLFLTCAHEICLKNCENDWNVSEREFFSFFFHIFIFCIIRLECYSTSGWLWYSIPSFADLYLTRENCIFSETKACFVKLHDMYAHVQHSKDTKLFFVAKKICIFNGTQAATKWDTKVVRKRFKVVTYQLLAKC